MTLKLVTIRAYGNCKPISAKSVYSNPTSPKSGLHRFSSEIVQCTTKNPGVSVSTPEFAYPGVSVLGLRCSGFGGSNFSRGPSMASSRIQTRSANGNIRMCPRSSWSRGKASARRPQRQNGGLGFYRPKGRPSCVKAGMCRCPPTPDVVSVTGLCAQSDTAERPGRTCGRGRRFAAPSNHKEHIGPNLILGVAKRRPKPPSPAH